MCKWIIRPSNNPNDFFAFTTCKSGFNYLSKAKNLDEVKSAYQGKECPICKNKIELDFRDIEEG